MREVEIKILEIDRPAAVSKLEALGARMVFDDEIHALYYDTAGSTMRARGIALRLRREGRKAVLTVKRDLPDKEAKVREEQEVEVSDFSVMRQMLESLGLTVWLEMKKHRTSYALPGIHFEFDRYFDNYSHIPEFLEIEGPDIESICQYASLLGYTRQDCRPWDAVQVARHYAELRR